MSGFILFLLSRAPVPVRKIYHRPYSKALTICWVDIIGKFVCSDLSSTPCKQHQCSPKSRFACKLTHQPKKSATAIYVQLYKQKTNVHVPKSFMYFAFIFYDVIPIHFGAFCAKITTLNLVKFFIKWYFEP